MAEHEEGQRFESHSIGERLRLAREDRGLSLDDIASRTRIPIRHLQHIEVEEWDALPAVTYCIGFVRNYANAVGLNGAEIARDLRERIGGPRPRAAPPEFYEMADPARVPPRALAVVAALIAAVLLAGYLIWRASLGGDGSAPSTTVAEAPPPGTPQPAPATPAPPPAAGQPVTLTATGEVWLRIDDGIGGPQLFFGILNAGERFQVPATAQRPLLRTGRPQNLRVSVGGRDLGPIEAVERVVDNVSLRPQDLAARPQGAMPPPAQ